MPLTNKELYKKFGERIWCFDQWYQGGTKPFGKTGLLSTLKVSNKKMFVANTNHPLYSDIHNMLKKTYGINHIIEQITNQAINLQSAYLTGDFAIGKDSKIIDLTLVGNHLDHSSIEILVQNAERLINHRIKFIVLTRNEMVQCYNNKTVLQIWKQQC